MRGAERWLPIDGWPPYEISDRGNVRRIARSGRHKPKQLKPFPNSGYMRVNLCHNGRRQLCDIHVLMTVAFIGPKPFEDAEVNHKNGSKLDNRVENFEWTTRQGNAQHAHDHRLQVCKGDRNGYSKLSDGEVQLIRAYRDPRIHGVAKMVAGAFEVSIGTVYDIWARRTWSHLPTLGAIS